MSPAAGRPLRILLRGRRLAAPLVFRLACVAIGLAASCPALQGAPSVTSPPSTTSTTSATSAAYGPGRPPWTTSRITGSPQAPLPYRVERTFPKLSFNGPVDLCTAPGSDRLFVVELGGKIFSFPVQTNCEKADLFLDLRQNIPGTDQAYGITFHPRYPSNHFVYVAYVLRAGLPDGSRVSRFTVLPGNPPHADPASEKILITWPSGGHNGECIKFGPDGYLYISTGDGAGPDPPDRLNTGQDLTDLLASMLRIDVDHPEPGRNYRVPPDNPFLNTPGARPEIWAYGLRNPFKMNFDPKTGELWVGDVGYEKWELIHRVRSGGNYGWSIVEGRQSIRPTLPRGPTPITPPVVDHPHSEATCITGGLFYTGDRLPELTGAYLYGDYASTRLWGLRHDGHQVTWHQWLATAGINVISFAQDNAGELHILNYGGTLHRLVRNTETASPDRFPRRLGESGLFASMQDLSPAPGVIPYSIRAEPWADHASAQRLIGIPGHGRVNNTNQWLFPPDTVLVKTLSLEMERGQPGSRRRIETQVLHLDRGLWRGYSYRWNREQTEAELVADEGADDVVDVVDSEAPEGRRRQTWHFPSRSECMRCHNPYAGTLLGFNARQLNVEAAPGQTEQGGQLRTLGELSILSKPLDPALTPRFPNPHDAAVSLETRARAYLHLNCAHCHRENSGGAVAALMMFDLPLADTKMLETQPTQGNFAIPEARVIAAGDPTRSVLYYRISKTGLGHMPHLGASLVDVPGANLIHDWIRQLSAARATNAPGLAQPAPDVRDEECIGQLRRASAGPLPAHHPALNHLFSSPRAALSLVNALNRQRFTKEAEDAVLRRAGAETDGLIRDLFERFLPETARVKTLGTAVQPEEILGRRGDPDQGRNLFFEEGGRQCFRCHQVHGRGTAFGPDLSIVGRKFNRAQLLEQILYPSRVIAPEFVAYQIETDEDTVWSGVVVKKDEAAVVLRDASGRDTRIPAGRIKSMTPQALSAMPEQLLQGMTAQSAADLIDYLGSLQ